MLIERFARFAFQEIEHTAFGVFAPAGDADDGFFFRAIDPDGAIAFFAAADDMARLEGATTVTSPVEG